MRRSPVATLFVSTALSGVWPGPAIAADVTIKVTEAIVVTDVPEAFPPVSIDVVEMLEVMDAPGALPPVSIEVRERVRVEDDPLSFPPVSIDVAESIGVADSPGAFPPVSIDVLEAINLADVPAALPPVAINVVEGIAFADGPSLHPPVAIEVKEGITVADNLGVFPPVVVSVVETVAVSDVAVLLPPVSIAVAEVVKVTDSAIVAFTDSDGDGVDDLIEDAAPNGGDGNADGVPDRMQGEVASLLAAAGGGAVTLELGPGCTTLLAVEAVPESALPPDPSFDHPLGLVRFRVPCSSATLTTLWHGTASLAGPWRHYGPVVPGSPGTAAWYTLAANLGTRSVGGVATATATIDLLDGQPGDDTGTDGWIEATGGPSVFISLQLPALLGVASVLLGVLILAIGVRLTSVSVRS